MATLSNRYKHLGKNIKSLRTVFGETQLDLAIAIGVGSSAISQYESGERVPERDFLLRIAKHYRITEDELLYGDFDQPESRQVSITNLPLGDPSFNIEIMKKLFPLICTDKALQNQDFRRAYELHTELLSQLRVGMELDVDKTEQCFELYEAARKDGLVEATANHLWWLMFMGSTILYCTPRLFEIIHLVRPGKMKGKDILNALLPSYDEDSNEEDFDTSEDRLEFLEDFEKDILIDISRLRKSKMYADLGDYYLALRHKFSLLKNARSTEINDVVGEEMLLSFKQLGNKYCKNYFKIFHQLITDMLSDSPSK